VLPGTVGYEWFTTSQELLDYVSAHSTPSEELGVPRSLAQIREPLPDALDERQSHKQA